MEKSLLKLSEKQAILTTLFSTKAIIGNTTKPTHAPFRQFTFGQIRRVDKNVLARWEVVNRFWPQGNDMT